MGSFSTLAVLLSASSALAATVPAYAPAPTSGGSDCATRCTEAYNACRGAPDANFAGCAGELAACVNYNPFDNSGTFVTPTACSASSTASVTATVPTYAPAPTAGGSDCAERCNDAFDTCRSAPDANRATCAAELAACVNYNPFATQPFVSPTACSASSTASATTSVTATVPTYAPAPTAGGSDCAERCNDVFDTCRSAPDANRATCAAELAACVNYNPFATQPFVSPTACSASSTSMATHMPSGMPTTNGTHGAPSATYSAPPQYTGAASLLSSCGSLVMVAAGAVGMLI